MDSPTRASDEAYAAACEAGDRVACRLPRSAALSPRNERKNRYTNVLPFDSNRVVLEPRAGAGAPTDAEGGGDYVNASWVRPRLAGDGGVECVLLEGAAPPPAQQAALRRALPADYIACQGPLPNTTGDFWRMVAQTRAAAIVMLTGYVEGYSEKCAEYLPRRPGQEQTYAGGVRVRCVAVQSMALEGGEDASDTAEPAGPAVATEVQLEVRLPADGAGGEPHRVSQFHFLEWHDHNVPEERHLPGLARLSRRVRLHAVAAGGPVVVHCSAGIGRTGTYIAFDASMGEAIASGHLFELPQLVAWLRTQRVMSVQSAAQYKLAVRLIKSELPHLEQHRRVVLSAAQLSKS